MADFPSPTAWPLPYAKQFRIAALAILTIIFLFLCVGTIRTALVSSPSFDGAMNLEVASSLSHGEGYRRTYADREVFPHEVQTGATYVLPSALVFKLWGVGIPQAQIINILYFILLLGTACALLWQNGGRVLALLATVSVAAVPGMLDFGFDGYGEVPALALFLAAAAVFYRAAVRRPFANAGFAGVLLGLAFITKTVMLIGVSAMFASVALEWLSAGTGYRRPLFERAAALAIGVLGTLILMEIWRGIALGGVTAWSQWWSSETRGIFEQAGITPGYSDTTGGLLEKLQLHVSYLGEDYRLAMWLTVLWLMSLCAVVMIVVLRSPRRKGQWSTLTVLLTAFVYMAWWLLITPTAKAWHRRILDGMICADLGMLMFVATWLGDLRRYPTTNLRKMAGYVASVLLLTLPLLWLVKGLRTVAHSPDPSDQADAVALMKLAKQVHDLPANSYLFGIGWYSAPRVALFSGRSLLDFNDLPEVRMRRDYSIHFVQEAGLPPDYVTYLHSVKAKYQLPDKPVDIYTLISSRALTPRPLVAKAAPVRRYLKASDEYPYMHGFNESEGDNGRWLSDDNSVLLTPQAGDQFVLAVYTLPVSSYLYKSASRATVSFNRCTSPAQSIAPDAVSKLIFPIPPACNIVFGQPVTVRIEIDNLLDSSILSDQRSLSVLSKEFGFAGIAQ